jgi:hypothetical protein
MGFAPFSLKQNYWNDFEVLPQDLEFLYNHLLEIETPLTPDELVKVLVQERIRIEKIALENQQTSSGKVYLPKEKYAVGQNILFPALDWKKGQVESVRPGSNPELSNFDVIEVAFETGEKKSFAASLETHILNTPIKVNLDDPQLDLKTVLKLHGAHITQCVTEELDSNPDLVRIAGKWFPRALLVDINIGHLNLVEAVLEMEGGGPLKTPDLMEQIDLPKDVNSKLNEFSLNLALQEDKRFDEVGPAGKILWYLHRLEPEPVQTPPIYLRYTPTDIDNGEVAAKLLTQFEGQLADELGGCEGIKEFSDEITVSLIYPHLRAGTLPVCDQMYRLFPTAIETPRVQFTFVDGDTGQKFEGWVVRPYKYAFGLREWYARNELIPGSLVTIQRGSNPEEVVVRANRKRPVRDWVRTAMIGSDGGIVFALLKHSLSTSLNERMAIVISDNQVLDQLWEQGNKQRASLSYIVKNTMRELAKLSPQGHVHAQELYAAVNVIRRCPPGPILNTLLENPWAVFLGDLYFRLDESAEEER